MKAKLILNNLEETNKLGLQLSKQVFEGFLLLLGGELGAGKTALAKSIGRGLQIDKIVKSPTFNILRCYDEGKIPLYHIDAYRLEDVNQDLGLEEYIEGDGVCIIEWYKFIKNILPKEYLQIEINIIDENKRELNFESQGKKYDEILKKVIKLWK